MDTESDEPELDPNTPIRPDREERLNFTTHAIGFVLACIAVYFLLPAMEGNSLFVRFITWIYATSMLSLYAASALSHYYHRSRLRTLYRKLDQSLIFIFIVAGFTPYYAVYLTESWAWFGVAVLWLVAVAGFVSKLFYGHRVEGVATWTYLALGWTPVLAMPFASSMPLSANLFISIGGIIYTLGVAILLQDHRRWYMHSIWHVFVIAGSAVHYWGIYQSLIS